MPAERRLRQPARGRRPAILRAAVVAFLLAGAVALLPGGPATQQVAAVAAGPSPVAPPPDDDGEQGTQGFEPAPEEGGEPAPAPEGDDLEWPTMPPPTRPPAPRTRVDRDVSYRGAYGPTLDVHHPAAGLRRRSPAVLVVHGGGWRGGDKSALSQMARSLAAAGFVAVNVNYTLATPWRAGFPTQLDELRAAVRWIRVRADELRVDPERIGAVGSSAGAHLAALLGTSGHGPLTAGTRIRAVVSWSGPFDLAPARMRRLRGHVAGFVGCWTCRRRRASASPIAHVTPDDPPMLIVNSRHEMIHASQARRMAARLRAAHVPRRLRLLRGTVHAPRYAPIVRRPTIAFLERWLLR